LFVCLEIGIIHVTDRHGDIVDEIPMPTSAPILALQWDKDGEYLAILQDGNGVVPLWSVSSKRVVPLETNLRDLTFLSCATTKSQLLAIGTTKGHVVMCNKAREQLLSLGKQAKMITCGAWNKNGNKLALGSAGQMLTVLNEKGDTLLHTEVPNSLLEVSFPPSSTVDEVVCANLNGKSMLLYNFMDKSVDPVEFAFARTSNGRSCRYGKIVRHQWVEEGLMLVGFSGGYLLTTSTNPHDLGVEKCCNKFHGQNLIAFDYNPQLQCVATAGDDGVRIIDIHDFNELKKDFISSNDLENGQISCVNWTSDGRILTVSTTSGNLYNFKKVDDAVGTDIVARDDWSHFTVRSMRTTYSVPSPTAKNSCLIS
jgi:WD repeat-containing protein 19